MLLIDNDRRMNCAFEDFPQNTRILAGVYRTGFSAGFQKKSHLHDFPQVWYCYSGTYWHQVGEEIYECKKGSMIVVPVGVPHFFWCNADAGVEVIRMNIHYNILKDARPDAYVNFRTNTFLIPYFSKLGLSFTPYKMLSEHSQKQIEQIFSWLALLNHTPYHSSTEEQMQEKLEEIFSLPEYAIPKKIQKRTVSIVQNRLNPVLRIVDHLNTHYSEKITDEQLLQAANLSRAVMYRHFKEIMQETYSRYLQHMRVRHAHCLMRDAAFTMSQIADLCGFYSSYHMAQTYTRFVGKAPSEARLMLERIYGSRQGD